MGDGDRDADLLARWAGVASTPAREAALLAQLPEHRRAGLLERLRIIDGFMRAQDEGRADAAASARRLGLTERSLYRLAQLIRERGAMGALAPLRSKARKVRRDAGGGLSAEADGKIMTEMLLRPNQSLGALVSRVREVDPAAKVSTIRDAAMRHRRNLDPVPDARFGREWLLDQAALRIAVEDGDGPRWLVSSFLVDLDTSAVFGFALPKDDRDPALGVISHALGRVDGLLRSRLKIASRISRITWVVPDGMLAIGDAVVEHAAALSPPVEVRIMAEGKFRRGVQLSRLLGGNLGGTDVLIRATADPRADLGDGDPAPVDRDKAMELLEADVTFAARMLARWAIDPSKRRTPSATRVRSLQRLMGQLVDVFEPALAPGDFASARERVARIGEQSPTAG